MSSSWTMYILEIVDSALLWLVMSMTMKVRLTWPWRGHLHPQQHGEVEGEEETQKLSEHSSPGSSQSLAKKKGRWTWLKASTRFHLLSREVFGPLEWRTLLERRTNDAVEFSTWTQLKKIFIQLWEMYLACGRRDNPQAESRKPLDLQVAVWSDHQHLDCGGD